jgi:hypothetical protein
MFKPLGCLLGLSVQMFKRTCRAGDTSRRASSSASPVWISDWTLVAPAGNSMMGPMGDGSLDGGLMLADPPQHLVENGGEYGLCSVARDPPHIRTHQQHSTN